MEKISNELDAVVLNIFGVLEDLNTEQDKLEKLMKDGFLGISRTRYSLGVKRVSSDQFVDAQLMASRTVQINEALQEDKSAQDSSKAASTPSDVFQVHFENLSLSESVKNGKDEKTKDSSNEPGSLTNLRKRINVKSGSPTDDSNSQDANNSEENKDKKSSDSSGLKEDITVSPKQNQSEDESDDEPSLVVTNPLKLFGILIPQHLRSSQKCFEEAVTICVNISNLKYRLGSLQTEYKALRHHKSKLASKPEHKQSTVDKEIQNEA